MVLLRLVLPIDGENIKGGEKTAVNSGALQSKFVFTLYNSSHTLENPLVHNNLHQKANNTHEHISVTYVTGQGLML